jgi:hypothetical protein
MDMIDNRLKILIKQQGYLDMYTGIDILQTRYYIKINLRTFIDKIFEPYLATLDENCIPFSCLLDSVTLGPYVA